MQKKKTFYRIMGLLLTAVILCSSAFPASAAELIDLTPTIYVPDESETSAEAPDDVQEPESLPETEPASEAATEPAIESEPEPAIEPTTEPADEPVSEPEPQEDPDSISMEKLIRLKQLDDEKTMAVDVTIGSAAAAAPGVKLESGILLAKRMQKLADLADFNTIIFRGTGCVNVRAGASAYHDKIAKMYYNAIATVLETVYADDGMWYHIQSGDVDGYVKSEFFISGVDAMNLASEANLTWVSTVNDAESLLESPYEGAVRVGALTSGRLYKSLGTENGFTKLLFGTTEQGTNVIGYVRSDRLNVGRSPLTATTLGEESSMQQAAAEASWLIQSVEASREASREASIAASLEESRIAESKWLEESKRIQRSIDESKRKQQEQQNMINAIKQRNWDAYAGYIPAGTSQLRRNIVMKALEYVDILPYIWGGESLVSGADCSGFCRAIYGLYGIDVAHYTVTINRSGRAVSWSRYDLSNIKPGDLVTFRITSDSGHVGIYIGNGYIVHSPRSGSKVSVDRIEYLGWDQITSVRNVID